MGKEFSAEMVAFLTEGIRQYRGKVTATRAAKFYSGEDHKTRLGSAKAAIERLASEDYLLNGAVLEETGVIGEFRVKRLPDEVKKRIKQMDMDDVRARHKV